MAVLPRKARSLSGPHDLRRGGKTWERPDPASAIGRKSHYVLARWGKGFAITVKRRGEPVETIMCASEAEVSRHRQRLTNDGLIGLNGDAL